MKESDKIKEKYEELCLKYKNSNDDLNKFKKKCLLFTSYYSLNKRYITPPIVRHILQIKKQLKEKIAVASVDLTEVGYFRGVNGMTSPDGKETYKLSREEYYPAAYKSFVDTLRSEEIAIKGILEFGLKPVVF